MEAIPARPTNIPLHAHALKTNLPNGMEYEAIFGWPRTATPSALYGLLGLLLLGTAGLLFLYPTKESPRT